MRTIVFSLFLLLAGCASESKRVTMDDVSDTDVERYNESVSTPQKLICTREVQVGSHFTKKVCRTQAQIEAAKRQVDEILRNTGADATNSDGG